MAAALALPAVALPAVALPGHGAKVAPAAALWSEEAALWSEEAASVAVASAADVLASSVAVAAAVAAAAVDAASRLRRTCPGLPVDRLVQLAAVALGRDHIAAAAAAAVPNP